MTFNRLSIKPDFLLLIPSQPGVYRFLSDKNDILYIGASSNLQKRISCHISNLNKVKEKKYYALKQCSKFVEYRCYSTAEKAFEAERVEIWTQQPPYNRRGVRIGSFSYLVFRISPFPQILCLRDTEYDKIDSEDEFYRFNLPSFKLKNNINLLRKIIPLCMPSSSSVCWDHHLNLCENECRVENKKELIRGYKQFTSMIKAISGANQELFCKWEDLITEYTDDLRFEEAQKILNALNSMRNLSIKFCGKGLIREVDRIYFNRVKGNRRQIHVLIHSYLNHQMISEIEDEIRFPDNIAFSSMILTYLQTLYFSFSSAPSKIQIYLPFEFDIRKSLENWLKRYFQQEISLEIFSKMKYQYENNYIRS
ncbi:MAG: GIY-YIG nuclease family protein [Candidatus Hermodarchaeota archaeon]